MVLDLLIKNGRIMSLAQGKTDLVAPGYIAIQNDRITALGSMTDLPAQVEARQTIDATNMLVMPGLINGHTHAAMTLFRGLADDLPLMTWLQEHIFPAEARFVDPNMVYWCSKLAAAEMLLAGTTTAADGYFHEDDTARAFSEAGMRAVVAQGVIDFPAPGVPDPAENIKAAEIFLQKWQAKDNQTIIPAVFCHSPYTCGPQTLQKAKELARARQALFFIHLAETEQEVQQCQEQHGKRPAEYLHDLGILDRQTVLVHCVWLTADEINLVAASGARVVTCPSSNMKLASGIAPLKEMLAAGIPVGLGTDGAASSNDLDIFGEMDLGAKLHKVRDLDPTALPASQLLGMATLEGAAVLGLDKEIGSLTPGKKADIILLDLAQPHLTPFYHADLLVYAAKGSDVRTVIVDGRVVVRDGQITSFDLQETMEQVIALSHQVKEEA